MIFDKTIFDMWQLFVHAEFILFLYLLFILAVELQLKNETI